MLVDTFANRLNEALILRRLKPVEVVKISEQLYEAGKINKPLNKPLISNYLKGNYEAKQDNIYSLSLILNIDEAWLMGHDVSMDRNSIYEQKIYNNSIVKIPLLGTVKAGYNYLAEENIIGYEQMEIVPDINNYYALTVKGDSMEPLFSDGDIAIIHKQDTFDDGNTCIVLINGDGATVKKVVKKDDGIDLIAMNPYYPTRHFSTEEIKKLPVQIIGKVVEARKRQQFK